MGMETLFSQLLEKFRRNQLTAEERLNFEKMIQSGQFDSIVENAFENDWTAIDAQAADTEMLEFIYQRIQLEKESQAPAKVVKLSKTAWAAAAAVILLVISTVYFSNSGKSPIPQSAHSNPIIQNDISSPSSSNAILTLGNGQRIILDSTGTGLLAQQGTIQVSKTSDGQIAYSGTTTDNITNTLTNPRGSKVINLSLSDGTKVWLNAGSSITFPAYFSGKERHVEINGEGYFEVAHNPSQPFIVSKGQINVTVLGTHFNVNAYDDESYIKITLLEGSVAVSSGDSKKTIKPGAQAIVNKNIRVIDKVDTEEIMAWKNGKFQFGDGEDIPQIMREISRWYDVKIEYKDIPEAHIGGTISRSVNASEVLKMLEMTGVVSFKIDGKKVIVSKSE